MKVNLAVITICLLILPVFIVLLSINISPAFIPPLKFIYICNQLDGKKLEWNEVKKLQGFASFNEDTKRYWTDPVTEDFVKTYQKTQELCGKHKDGFYKCTEVVVGSKYYSIGKGGILIRQADSLADTWFCDIEDVDGIMKTSLDVSID